MEKDLSSVEQAKHLELYPTPEDWNALQGGKPRIFRYPDNPNAPWIVLHVYDEHPDPETRFQSGAVVDTRPPEKIELLRKGIIRSDEDGNPLQKDIMVPSFMDRNVHGDVCQTRSNRHGGESYSRITTQRQYEGYIGQLRKLGYEELRFGAGKEGFTLTPQPIRDARELVS